MHLPASRPSLSAQPDERKAAELTRQRAVEDDAACVDRRDLRTPLTAIRVAANNIKAEWSSERPSR